MYVSADQPRVVAGRYRLDSVLGAGSMGTVWVAHDEFLQRQVALKEVHVPPGVPAEQLAELRERTLREARAIAALSHPNVVVLHDVVREGHDPYVVMELLPSRSLASILDSDRQRLTTAQAVTVAEAVAAALEAAHAAGITHRDVKPGNVLIADDGRIKLTDFGIARNVSEVTMTHTGMMLGSPAFIAPEVASGGAVTYAADLWGLGATLFAATEGRPPYDEGGDPLATVTEVVRGTPPTPSPGPLAVVIQGLMAKEPSARTPLAEVRRRLRPMLPPHREDVFPASLFDDTEAGGGHDPGATQIIPRLPAAQDAEPAPETTATDGSESGGSGELAADPGPLPFAPSTGPSHAAEPEPASRRRLVLISAAVIAVFLLAVAGGFLLVRTVSGQSLAPPAEGAQPERTAEGPESATPQPLQLRHGDATNMRGAKGGLFTVRVPSDWKRFVTQRPADTLPTSTHIQFVSADGARTLGVERFAGEDLGAEQYVGRLRESWTGSDFTLVQQENIHDGEGLRITYRTAERGGRDEDSGEDGRAINRSTTADVFPTSTGLWVVAVTVPVDQERLGRQHLFERIVPTFRQTD
ncbi:MULTISPECIES: serine/threonine-protein kinase [Prauserella salsuginis group]|uniref:serine/threonine-protein kinase n=1 Tax=Prauserella salsuginis group TaxID=2893672 RepID=UPI00162002B5|nr:MULTISPECIES: serine/threonine-protein kinase [Prauserella salsuginis group]